MSSILGPNCWSLDFLRQAGAASSHVSGPLLHPNPRLYKFEWWVCHDGNCTEGAALLEPARKLCTHDAMQLMQQLARDGSPYLTFTRRLHRQGPPFVLSSKIKEWAPPYDEDNDRAWEGHK